MCLDAVGIPGLQAAEDVKCRLSKFFSRSAEETISRGRELAASLQPPLLILLTGELGAGKTTLAKGIISGLRVAAEQDITSPTFTLIHTFTGPVMVFHVDLYRVSDVQDFDTLGLEDLFAEPAIVLIEWPERMRLRTDWPVLRIALEHVDEAMRNITIAEIVPEKLAQRSSGKA